MARGIEIQCKKLQCDIISEIYSNIIYKIYSNIISEIYSDIISKIYSNIIYWTLTFCLTPVDNGEQIPNHYRLQEKTL